MLHQSIAPFRRINPAILSAQCLASEPLTEDIVKKDLAMTLKRAAPVLKITGTPYQILDILLGLVRAEDLRAGGRPLVAISNEKLAQYTDRSTRTVSRCIKRLVEAGILAYADSPNGRRFIRRDRSGAIDYGYGLDLTPACMRLQELQESVTAFQEQLKLEKQARRLVVARARAVKDLALLLGDTGISIMDRLEGILALPLDPVSRAKEIETIYQNALQLETKLSCLGDKNGAAISNTTHPHIKKEVETNRNASNETSLNSSNDNGANTAVEVALEKKPVATYGKLQTGSTTALPSSLLAGVSIGLLSQACSEVGDLLQVQISNWNTLFALTEDLRHLIGLSEAGWNAACTAQGRHLAAACLVVVAEKALRDPEAIGRPGGYFRAMIERANDDKLNLQKSIFGLVRAYGFKGSQL
ncbi:plasmid replication protein RepC [Pseudovibrio sp. Tun.PSC04-5.I4]|uniref:plasmid replication protein RepC n=1 Tax=Pseudovibrio sp. Tun.PSC04-5.I4 TaxID=1798213 RepID=UPI00088E2E74|nr:plasmid replication protein RepC [Pseudovibrio sp. Tun.PSC04-5.I4]SDR45611.1 replication initiation protein RepC [Pseudovibrio sp. Tun.PSC04-5.I4]